MLSPTNDFSLSCLVVGIFLLKVCLHSITHWLKDKFLKRYTMYYIFAMLQHWYNKLYAYEPAPGVPLVSHSDPQALLGDHQYFATR